MKGNIRKLSVFVIIAAIAMFIAVGIASADQTFPIALRGEYAATMVLSGIFSIGGFNPDQTPKCYTPPSGSPICISSVSMSQRQGFFAFEKDGTGSAKLDGSAINISPPSGVTQTITFDFTYSVDEDGMITITGVPGTWSITYTSGPNKGATIYAEGLVFTGPISPDGKIINLVASHFSTLIIPIYPRVENNNFGQGTVFLTWQHDEQE